MKVSMDISLGCEFKLAACLGRTALLAQLDISLVAGQEIDLNIIFGVFISQ